MTSFDSIGARLRKVREDLGLSQSEMAAFAANAGARGATRQSQALYEKGDRYPDAAYLGAIVNAGADVLYILTGTTADMRATLNNVRSATEVAQAVGGSREQQLAVQEAEFHRLQAPRMSDLERLAAAIGAVEEGLAETRRKLPPDKRAELIFAAYQLMAEPQQTRDNVVRLVRTAA